MKILVTGAAGFIGSALALQLMRRGDDVVGIDTMNDYYDVGLKEARLRGLAGKGRFVFERMDIADRAAIRGLFAAHDFDVVVNLAAQAGVRYSLVNPDAYVDTNVVGFGNILEGCRHSKVGHFVFASSSSVYGANTRMPFSESDNVDHPVSLYAATKKAGELMAHSYANLYGIPCTGLRFFTVYGPWGRPDMAYHSFTRKILAGEPLPVFNEGRMMRDFTYIDDIVTGVINVIDRPAQPDTAWNGDEPNPATSYAPFRVYNIGNHQPVQLLRFIEILESNLGRKATLDMLPMQDGDVRATYADITALNELTGFVPSTSLEDGLKAFVEWYLDYYGERKPG